MNFVPVYGLVAMRAFIIRPSVSERRAGNEERDERNEGEKEVHGMQIDPLRNNVYCY